VVNQIGDIGGKAIGDGLKENKSLEILGLSIFFDFLFIDFIVANQIGDIGGKAIGDGLKENKSLEKLYLGIFFDFYSLIL